MNFRKSIAVEPNFACNDFRDENGVIHIKKYFKAFKIRAKNSKKKSNFSNFSSQFSTTWGHQRHFF